ncbi:16S rRNA (cytosine(1402)-N(4))-methyltransferase RsmH [Candidatus Saccharibacteria bacterium]|nr:16S rRNA (cytosine(1402)-N(4))-methyltransferase RsmH [Candidatus Saccharibacteria bacterium]
MKITPQQLHIPVLLDAVLDFLKPRAGERYLDLTAGYGGHARAVIARTRNAGLATLVDRDDLAIKHLKSFARDGARLIHLDFYQAAQDLVAAGEQFDMILLDLGVSSPQLDLAERGFSFSHDGNLDMRMDCRQNLTAAEIVNHYSTKDLANLIQKYGGESPKRATKIANSIVRRRTKKMFNTTTELADLIAEISPRRNKIHPATRTFQALRIETNDELGQLEKTLPLLPQLLKPGGRLAIISFHSLEDAQVKNFLREQKNAGYEAELVALTKHPIAGKTDDVHNPRARSAKLRVAAKINK